MKWLNCIEIFLKLKQFCYTLQCQQNVNNCLYKIACNDDTAKHLRQEMTYEYVKYLWVARILIPLSDKKLFTICLSAWSVYRIDWQVHFATNKITFHKFFRLWTIFPFTKPITNNDHNCSKEMFTGFAKSSQEQNKFWFECSRLDLAPVAEIV